jgi:excisionase family DNA binding protein
VGSARARTLPVMSLKNLLTVKEVAALLRVSTQTLYKMLEQGQIPAVKVGSQWRFDGDKIKSWIERQGVPAPAEPSSPGESEVRS